MDVGSHGVDAPGAICDYLASCGVTNFAEKAQAFERFVCSLNGAGRDWPGTHDYATRPTVHDVALCTWLCSWAGCMHGHRTRVGRILQLRAFSHGAAASRGGRNTVSQCRHLCRSLWLLRNFGLGRVIAGRRAVVLEAAVEVVVVVVVIAVVIGW